ncbi:sulfatase-like hydrolase/transferase [Novosphingobium flavum]|uniref:Sulfatase-like hydrolase/transferase n=1 Tax=Novosphingobium flavum TaxID=1778672 RepID=A0A7X1KKY9_9SPHN|nr:sulfatase-like hydrolase/transferase [Novosphingobium flavum]MBC2664992.1 sulfatase-like hydrolase/transferase [Novosphingobium flavum]
MFRHFPWRWALYWLVAPNLAIVLMWPFGGPPMGKPILIAGCFGLIFSQAPWLWLRRTCGMLLTLGMVTFYIARNFNIDPSQIAFAPTYFSEASPLRSAQFGLGVAAVLVSLGIVWTCVPRVQRFAIPMNWLMGFLAVTGAMHFDTYATAATRGTYDAISAPVNLSSAVETSGHSQPRADRRNLVVILVEALGMPNSPVTRRLFEADWDRPEWRARYNVNRGTVPYYGSTTNAEMRELCGVWSLNQVADFSKTDCLPRRFARAGYETTAMHAFTGEFFGRATWWKEAGFDHTLFREKLVQHGARICGGVFPGACDEDVPGQIAAGLKRAVRPQLVYWVTLNSHLPVVEAPDLGTDNCTFGGPELAEQSDLLCPLFLVHHRLADAITRMALDPTLPPTDILIVGDHMPPFFQRDARAQFEGHEVPWVLLQAKGGSAPRAVATNLSR